MATGFASREQMGDGILEETSEISAKYVAYLRCIKDTWSSCHAAKMLDGDLVKYLKPRFVMLSTPLKRKGCIDDLLEVVKQGETDPNEWVKKLSRLLLPFMTSGRVDLRETDTETAFRIINFLDEQTALHPEEGTYQVKGGLEAPHISDPTVELKAALELSATDSADDPLGAALQLPSTGALELSLFTARESLDLFLDGVVRKGTSALRKAERAQKTGQS